MDDKLNLLKQCLGQFLVKFNEPLTYHTFTKSPILAKFFYTATNQHELIDALNCARQLKIPYFILGAGTKFIQQGTHLNALVLKNRSTAIKISGIKGKVGKGNVGIEEALVEADSGVSIAKMNEFLKIQGLQLLNIRSAPQSTLGGSIWVDHDLQLLVQKIKFWDRGEVLEGDVSDLKNRKLVILSAVFKMKTS